MDKAPLVASSLHFLRHMQIPHTQRNTNSKKSTPRPGFTATTKQPVGMARDMERGREGRRRRKKVLTGMPSLVKAAERQREWKEVSVTPRETG